MAAPDHTKAWHIGAAPSGVANYSQTNDTAAMGGGPDTVQLADSSLNLLFDASPANPAGGADILHRNVFYHQNKEGAGGKMNSGQIALLNGLRLSSGTGVLTFTLTNSADANLTARIICLVGGASPASPELVRMVSPSVNSITSPDTGGTYRVEFFVNTGTVGVPVLTPTAPQGDILIAQAGQYLGRNPGSGLIDHLGNTMSISMVTAEYELAVASAKNTALSSSDRLHEPTGIGAYSRPILIDGYVTDASIPVPSLNDGEYCGFAIRRTLKAGLPTALVGFVILAHEFRFSASA